MDLFTSLRLEERYAKAGYKYENMRFGIELLRLRPMIRENVDLTVYAIGMFELTVEGVACYLIKTIDTIMFGTYNDLCATAEGERLVTTFLNQKNE